VKNKRRILVIALSLLILATVAFIWSNSMDSREISASKSDTVKGWLEPFLELIVGRGNVTEHLVRKLAHFVEYGFLGTLLGTWLLARKVWKWRNVGLALFLGLTTASIDETIQIFTGRGPMVRDVLLDFSGVMTGVGFVWLLVLLVEGLRKRND